MKKPSTMTGNSPLLLHYFENLKCKCKPGEHLSGEGHARELQEAQAWTWLEANCIIAGIMRVRQWHRKHEVLKSFFSFAFPVTCAAEIAPAQSGGEPGHEHEPHPSAPPDKKQCKCYGCRNSRPLKHWQHNRKFGECKFPYVSPFIPTCKACYDMKSINAALDGEWLHTFDKGCWHTGAKPRTYAPRRGKHPRDPAHPAAADETVGQRGDAGIEAELELDARRGEGLQSASSSSAAAPMAEGSAPIGDGSHKSSKPERRERAGVPKKKEGWPDTLGGDGSADPDDWTQFDIARVLRTLRMATLSQAKVTLRKLHIRWWHASSSSMHKLLDRAGIPNRVLELIPSIVQTCAACRSWSKPQPENVTNVNLPDRFNHQCEADLMFVYDVIVFHILDP